MTMTVYKALEHIQRELKAPKNQYNSFGKYKYRSCEDILEGVKKVMPDGFCVTLSDDIIERGGRIYVEATVSLRGDNDIAISAHGYAREPLDKKGMDESQITGTASSYARKYALNGLFCIDDTKDADSDEHENQKRKDQVKKEPEPKQEKKSEATPEQKKILESAIAYFKNCKTADDVTKWFRDNIKDVDTLSAEQVEWIEKQAAAKKKGMSNG